MEYSTQISNTKYQGFTKVKTPLINFYTANDSGFLAKSSKRFELPCEGQTVTDILTLFSIPFMETTSLCLSLESDNAFEGQNNQRFTISFGDSQICSCSFFQLVNSESILADFSVTLPVDDNLRLVCLATYK